jgi:hypothetical protein
VGNPAENADTAHDPTGDAIPLWHGCRCKPWLVSAMVVNSCISVPVGTFEPLCGAGEIALNKTANAKMKHTKTREAECVRGGSGIIWAAQFMERE